MPRSDIPEADPEAAPATSTEKPAGSRTSGSLRRTPEIVVAIGSRIRAARIAAGVSQGALGASVGISFQQVQKYENGKNRVAADILQEFAAALGVHPGSFFEGDMPLPVGSISDVQTVRRAVDALRQIRDPRVLKQLIALAEELATFTAGGEQAAPVQEKAP